MHIFSKGSEGLKIVQSKSHLPFNDFLCYFLIHNGDAVASRPCANLNLEAMARGRTELCQFLDYFV